MCVKVNFINTKSDVPIVKYQLCDGTEGFAIIDTGSEVTTFDVAFAKKHKKQFDVHTTKTKMSMIGLGANAEQIIVHAAATFVFADVEDMKNNLLIQDAMLFSLKNINDNLRAQYDLDITISAILGSDVLQRYAAKINYKNKTISFSNDLSGK